MASPSRFVKPVSITVLLVLSSTFLHFLGHAKASPTVSSESDIALTIADAEQRIVICYHAVAEADNVGANTTALLARLNEAGWHLSRARWAYEVGDFDQASHYALLSQQRLEGLVADAETLKQSASKQKFGDFMTNVVGSIVATLMVIFASCVVWILLKRRPENL